MRYVIVSTHPADYGMGIGNYTAAAACALRRLGVDVHVIENRDLLPHDAFRARVAAEVTRRFHPRDTLIEAPETWSPTLMLGSEWRVHIRLHCPGAVLSFANSQPIDLERFGRELTVARQAATVSSPSRALRELLRPYLGRVPVRVYPNPPLAGVTPAVPGEKDIDLLFMARFDGTKGAEHLQWLLPLIPEGRKVVLLGRGCDLFRVPQAVRAEVALHGFDPSAARFRLLRRARALLVLSRFENGPMAVYEALAHGTPVVGWDVGGIGEIAAPPLVELAPWGDRAALLAKIEAVLRRTPPVGAFAEATQRLSRAFANGVGPIVGTANDAEGRSETAPAHATERLRARSLSGFHELCQGLLPALEPVAAVG